MASKTVTRSIPYVEVQTFQLMFFEMYTFWKLNCLLFRLTKKDNIIHSIVYKSQKNIEAGAPNENIVQNHLNIALLNVF